MSPRIPVRLAMWSGPRNISTAMMRAWENRDDTAVWDEPLYAYFLNESGSDHPDAKQVIEAGEPDWRKVVAKATGPAPGGKTIYFQKHMTHHLLEQMDWSWLARVTNCFLIRDPREVIASYVKTRPNPTVADVGIPQQATIFDYATKLSDQTPLVLDAKDVLCHPRRMLTVLCERLDVEFSDNMLSWPAGSRASDGVWAKHWYTTVQRSTGFVAYQSKAHCLPAELQALAEECAPYYARLHEQRLRP